MYRIGIMNGKGGVGKTLKAVLAAKYLANHGKFVLAIDMDAQPGMSGIFARFQEQVSGQKNLMRAVRRDPQRRSLLRMVMQPELGLEGISWEYPMPAGSQGKLVTVPNGGEFVTMINEANREFAANPSHHPDLFLAQSIQAMEQHRRDQGLRPIDVLLIDSPGERGQLATMIFNLLDMVLIPMTPTKLALDAVQNIADDIADVQAHRGGRPCIAPVLVNAVRSPAHQRFIRNSIAPALAEIGLELYGGQIPWDGNYDDVINAGVIPFESSDIPEILAGFDGYFDQVFGGIING